MRSRKFTLGASALLVLAATVVEAKHGAVHERLESLHRKHRHAREAARELGELEERSGNSTLDKRDVCAFPSGAGLVAVTPGSENGGWAIAPDQSCTSGRYCPYACPPGQVSMQWDPSVTSYTYPGSMNGGLLCQNGQLVKPFPDRPYCQSTATNIGVQNNAGQVVSFCQTVLPGDEDMLIPTVVTDYATLAVPDTSYWAGTAAHYYINPPGVGAAQGCVWGSNANAVGNWAPYVAGANADATGQTFIKLGWNPIYLESTTPFNNVMPTFGVKIDCPNGGCNGLPCAIDPTQNKVNQMLGSATDGAGNGAFCVVTVAKGSTANFIVYGSGGSSAAQGGQFYQSSSSSSASSTTTSTTTTTVASTTTTTTTKKSTTTSTSSTDTYSWASNNVTTSTDYSPRPSGQPYYSLFNTSDPTVAAATSAGGAATHAANGHSPTSSTSASKTGAASTVEISIGAIILSLGAMLL